MEKFKFAGQILKIKETANEIGGNEFIAEDYWINIYPYKSWMVSDGNPACLIYAMRTGTAKDYRIPFDDKAVYGKIGGMGYLVHESELELPEKN